MPYIQETCVAGETIEVLKYFSYRVHTKGEKRSPKERVSTEAQKKVNQRKAAKTLRRLMNTNFKDGDFLLRLDFHKQVPKDSTEMQALTSKALRKLKTEYKKAGLELKYIYVKEVGKRGGRHIHMLVNKCPPECITNAWTYGGIHIDPLHTQGQYTQIADYFIKYAARTEETEGELIGKRWYGSRNLLKPKVTKKVITAKHFRKDARVIKGYNLYGEPLHGISEFSGFEYFSYTLIKSHETKGGA